MSDTSSKEKILKKIRKALSHPTPLPFPQAEGQQPVFAVSLQESAVEFAEQFSKLQGKFVYCLNPEELLSQFKALASRLGWTRIHCPDDSILSMLQNGDAWFSHYPNLADCEVSITGCEYLVARTGSLVLSSAKPGGRTASVYAPIHICIAYSHQLVSDVKEAIQGLKEKYGNDFPSMLSFASGPSRTADIEKTLVVGVHGPGEVYCFLLEG